VAPAASDPPGPLMGPWGAFMAMCHPHPVSESAAAFVEQSHCRVCLWEEGGRGGDGDGTTAADVACDIPCASLRPACTAGLPLSIRQDLTNIGDALVASSAVISVKKAVPRPDDIAHAA
jgi:hypothetical protein